MVGLRWPITGQTKGLLAGKRLPTSAREHEASPKKAAQQPVRKRPACNIRKRPVSSIQRAASDAGVAPSEGVMVLYENPTPVVKQRYTIMWYKRTHTVGLRQLQGAKRQFASFGGLKCKVSKEVLLKIGADCIKALLAGSLSEDEAKEWCRREL